MAPITLTPQSRRNTKILTRTTLALLITITASSQPATPATPTSLHSQTINASLTQRWPASTNPHLSWLVLDIATGQTLSQQALDPDTPIPVGSLTKPFLALAYARTHTTFPHLPCKGTADRCWLPQGHGTLDIQSALAHSCNAYFIALSQQIDPTALQTILQQVGLPSPPPDPTPATLIGLNPAWQIAPSTLARAYARLLTQPDAAVILAGLRQSATTGTASALHGQNALAKTGTAPCHHHNCIATSDGLVLVLTPADNPRTLLLLRQQGSTGAATATIAAQMLPLLEATHAR